MNTVSIVTLAVCAIGTVVLMAHIRRMDRRDTERNHWHTRPPS